MTVKILKKGNSIKTEPVKPSAAVLLSNKLIEEKTGIKNFHGVKVLKKKKLTPREKVAVREFAKLGKKAPALRIAGYPPGIVKNPRLVFDKENVDDEVKTILQELEDERKEVLKRMKITRKKAGYAVLSMTLGTLNRDIELLSGRPTDRSAYELPEEEKARLRKLLEKNKKK